MTYQIIDRASHSTISTHTTESAAIRRAKSLGDDSRYSVVAVEVSGTYRSRQQVWPVAGHCYSN